jgi:hypothetical protein
MSSTRVRGQEVEVRVITDGELETALTAIQSFEGELQFEQKDEGFLSEKTNRKDFIPTGARFSFSMQPESQDYFVFQQKVLELARRDVPSRVFNVIAIINFPNGDTALYQFNDVSFGNLPFTVGSRTDYATVRIEGSCSDVAVLTS